MTQISPVPRSTPHAPRSTPYDEAMQFWLGRINYELRVPQPGDLKLDRMIALLHLLGDPHRRFKIIHVAGSKGKGSTSAMLAAILRRAGYRTGLFTSPNLVRVEERFQVDNQPISSEELVVLLGEIRAASPGLRPPFTERDLTFFEIATAVGFMHFVRQGVEVAVLEVGLGGRLDSTNVCEPLLSIITSISFDHTLQLGNTLARIAGEKAGIVKPGRPVLSGVRPPEARAEIERICREKQAPLRQIDVDFRFHHEPACFGRGEPSTVRCRIVRATPTSKYPAPYGARLAALSASPARVQVTTNLRQWPIMDLALIGEHQAANAALVVASVEELRRLGLPIDDHAVAEGLAQVRWPARLEVVSRQPLVLLDCAHNVASIQALVETLHASFPLPADGQRFLIFAGSRDKDLYGIFEVLAPNFDRIFLTRFSTNPRCVAPEQAAELMPHEYRSACTLCSDVADAWHQARNAAGPNDLICVTGSVFLAGEMLVVAQNEWTSCSTFSPSLRLSPGSR